MLLLLWAFVPGQRLYAQTTTPADYQEESGGQEYDDTEEYTTVGETYTEEYVPDIAAATPPPVQRNRNINAARWDKLAADKAFQYEEPHPAPKRKQGDSAWLKALGRFFLFFTTGAGNVLIIAIVALIVVVIIVRIFQLRGNIFFARKDKKLQTETVDETSDLFIPDNWEKAIQDAAAAGNYRLAVRHGYRYLLNMLQEKEIIRFQAAKTNYQYAYDLSETKLHKPFLQLTRHYEYAWYGGFPTSKEGFEAYLDAINNIKRDLN